MKVSIPKVTRTIRLSDYAPEFGEQVIEMWVNPPRKKRLEFAGIMDRYRDTLAQIEQADEGAEELADLAQLIVEQAGELHAWYAEMWSQAGDEWSPEDVKALVEAALDTDPGLWDFVQESSLDAMREYRRRKKANSPGPQT
jgi:hypothetical protein